MWPFWPHLVEHGLKTSPGLSRSTMINNDLSRQILSKLFEMGRNGQWWEQFSQIRADYPSLHVVNTKYVIKGRVGLRFEYFIGDLSRHANLVLVGVKHAHCVINIDTSCDTLWCTQRTDVGPYLGSQIVSVDTAQCIGSATIRRLHTGLHHGLTQVNAVLWVVADRRATDQAPPPNYW